MLCLCRPPIVSKMRSKSVISNRETRHFTYPNGHEVYVIDIVYICKDFTPSGASPDDEVLEVRWFPFSDLPEKISPSIKDIIEQFICRVSPEKS